MPGTVVGTGSGTDDGSSTGKLPQTGQLVWPIPVLAVIGALAVMAGAYLMLTDGRREK